MSRRALLDDAVAAALDLSMAKVEFHTAVAECLGLGATEEKAVDILQGHGPLTAGDLAVRTGLAPATVTALIDKLEDKGFVHRRPHPDDGRRVLVVPEPAMAKRMAPLYVEFVKLTNQFLDRFTEDELDLIAEVLTEASVRQHEAAARL